mmetsp:Transcript_160908/g.283531  ORF Transcript_160908/g.283531 Transcript_160908/m.283531 type:complete len:230 (+) Transcript_160908:69-758(+)
MGHSAIDILAACAALAPVAFRAHQLGILSACASPACILQPAWWLLLVGIAFNYIMHAMIWNCPQNFTAISKQVPLNMLGSHPVDVFASLEVVAKLVQGASLLLFLGPTLCGEAVAAVLASPLWCWVAAAGLAGLGQTLNVAMYQAIGNAGVYYGFKLGRTVPWAYGFPFNVGLRHPQYVGVVLTLWGLLTLLLCEPLAIVGLPQAVVVWGSMYAIMSAMEQAGDNDKSE